MEPEPPSEVVADIGHVHLKVSNLERGISFYRDLIGMQVKSVHEGAAFLASVGITIISDSTPGAAKADLPRPLKRPASTTSRFAMPIGET